MRVVSISMSCLEELDYALLGTVAMVSEVAMSSGGMERRAAQSTLTGGCVKAASKPCHNVQAVEREEKKWKELVCGD
jgi:hypothetical protein